MIRGLQFGSLNHAPGGIINPPGSVMTDANTLILLRLSAAQPTWRGLPLTSSRSKMTHLRLSAAGFAVMHKGAAHLMVW
jgi:hypothetical protein